MRTCVVGLGQRIAGDDAVGLAVIELLGHQQLPNGVELRALRDASDLLELYGAAERLVIVDAVVDAAKPGTVLLLTREELDARAALPVSSHGLGVGQVLELARALHPHAHPDVRIVAVSVARPPHAEVGISPPVRLALAKAAEAVLAQLG